jgi:hypothetical protein
MRTFGVVAIVFAAGSAHAEGDPVDVLGEAALRSAAGDHLGAIERYEQAYRTSGDVELLTILGSEYHDAGKPGDAIQNLCAYLAVEPAGANAAFAAAQVRAIQAELGKQIPGDRDVCLPVAAVDLTLSPPALTPVALTPPSLTPPATVHTEVAAPQGWSNRELAGAATAALGLVSIGAGVYFGFQARSLSDQITQHPPGTPWPDNIRNLQTRGERDTSNELLLFATGSVALVTASVLYVTGRRARMASDRIAVAPAIAHGAAGLAISGGF